jgi:hypothetical protein
MAAHSPAMQRKYGDDDDDDEVIFDRTKRVKETFEEENEIEMGGSSHTFCLQHHFV